MIPVWGLQKFLDQFDGTLSTEAGYANGPDVAPTYKDVLSSGCTCPNRDGTVGTGGCTCPNRDGTVGTGGCTFCSEGGSGDFAALFLPLDDQIRLARQRVDARDL